MYETPLSHLGLIHGSGNPPVPVAADEVTPDWIRRTLADVRRIVAAGMTDRVRLLQAEAAMVAELPDASDRECRHMGQPELFAEEPAPPAQPNLPDAPSPLPGAAGPHGDGVAVRHREPRQVPGDVVRGHPDLRAEIGRAVAVRHVRRRT